MLKRTLSFIAMLLLPYFAGAQTKRGNIWYFGHHAAITFNTVSHSGEGFLDANMMNQNEGNATISDLNGALLFYTDGNKVWDRRHNEIATGLSAGSSFGSAQSALIAPLPGSQTLYYMFTVSDWYTTNGLNYVIVDMAAGAIDPQTGTPLGAVSSPVHLRDFVNEQITAAYHANGNDIWIITHESNCTDASYCAGHVNANPLTNNKFLAYKLTASGLVANPVESAVGSYHTGTNRYGYLRASNDGTKLASTLGGQNSNAVEIFNFNTTTGAISQFANISCNVGIYCSEFSPDNTQLYFADYLSIAISHYDLSSGTPVQKASLSAPYGSDALQVGSDGKIYVTGTNRTQLGVINNPDSKDAPNYVDQQVNLLGNTGAIGLPNLLRNYFNPLQVSFTNNTYTWECYPVYFVAEVTPAPDASYTFLWNFGDPASGAANTSSLQNPNHYYPFDTNNFTVSLTVTTGAFTRTYTKVISLLDPVADFSFIPACAGKLVSFTNMSTKLFEMYPYYVWDFGDGSPLVSGEDQAHVFLAPGTYNVTLTLWDNDQCTSTKVLPVTIDSCALSCASCIGSFAPEAGKKYVLSAWVKENNGENLATYTNAFIRVSFTGSLVIYDCYASGAIIDGWQRVEIPFDIPATATDISVELNNNTTNPAKEVYFDDIRIHPFDANMKSFVYDPVSLRLMAELDNNNYATFYEYDEEGKLIRLKKETQSGVVTIKENRDNTFKR